MKLRNILELMQTSRHNTYPLIHIADYGGSDIEGDFGYVDEVLALNDEYAFLLDAEVTHIDFSKSVSGDLYLEFEVDSEYL